jgi:non-ribosomal peptide synthetase component F
MNIEDSGQLFRVSVEYASLFNHIHFEQVFGNIFASIIQKPDIKIGDVELLNEHQTNEINALVNSRSKDIKKQHKKINEIFEGICAKYPDNTAIKYRDKSLTYRELNDMADNIAQNLMQQLTQKQRHVNISLDRSEVLVAAILGVLKAGRTYIPIDPNSPKERMEYIANSVDGAVLITDRQLPINFVGKSLLWICF